MNRTASLYRTDIGSYISSRCREATLAPTRSFLSRQLLHDVLTRICFDVCSSPFRRRDFREEEGFCIVKRPITLNLTVEVGAREIPMSGLTEIEDCTEHPRTICAAITSDCAKLTGGCTSSERSNQMIAHFSASHAANDAYRRRPVNRDLDNGSSYGRTHLEGVP